MDKLQKRLADLSPEKRALLELRMKKKAEAEAAKEASAAVASSASDKKSAEDSALIVEDSSGLSPALASRLAKLSPEKRALLEQKLKKSGKQVAGGKVSGRKALKARQAARSIPKRDSSRSARLSYAQERMWILTRIDSSTSAAYHDQIPFSLRGPLRVPCLRRALECVVERHEGLRTNFRQEDGEPRQVVADPAPELEWPTIDLSTLSGDPQKAALEQIALRQVARPFDFESGLLLRVLLVKLAEQEHVLILTLHHIISDGWSWGILAREMSIGYDALVAAQQPQLPTLPIQYADYAEWQREHFSPDVMAKALTVWKERLAGLPNLLELPTDRPRPAVQTYRGSYQPLDLSTDGTRRLEAFAREHKSTSFIVLLATLKALLMRLSGERDLAIGTPVLGRGHSETEGLIGVFINSLVLRSQLSSSSSFNEILHQVRRVTLEAFEDRELPFAKIVEAVKPDRNTSHSPLFVVQFQLQKVPPVQRRDSELEIELISLENNRVHLDLEVSLHELPDTIRGGFRFNVDLFDPTTIQRWIASYRHLIETVLEAPDRSIAELTMLSEAQHHQVLNEWNGVPAGAETLFVHQQIAATAIRQPEVVALVFGDEQLSYAELAQRAWGLAGYLQRYGTRQRLGIFIEPSLDMVIGLLGVLASSSAYIPLDPSYPRDRLSYMAEDAGLAAILTSSHLADDVPVEDVPRLLLDHPRDVATTVISPPVGQDLAYVIYTSGSTGKPKGVAIPQRSLTSFIGAFERAVGIDPADALLAVTPLSFDISGLEVYWPLVRGARLELVPREISQDGLALAAHRHARRVNVMQATPATWQILDASRTADSHSPFAGLRILCGGEALPRGLAVTLAEESEAAWNVYGPTEATIWATSWRLERSPRKVLLGRPLANTALWVVDAAFRPSALGSPGELLIGGDALAWGYLGRSALTAERFVPHPFSEEPGRRLYRTGDLTRQLADGQVEFLGRLDHQVKVRGFRIELGEIESVLDEKVRECVVMAEKSDAGARLVAYVVSELETADLRQHLQGSLPDYMVPSLFIDLDALPRLPNGKVNRHALAALALPQEERVVFVAPRNPNEELLAGIYARLLGCDGIGVHDSFFDLGGHSLLATQAIARIREALGVELPLRVMLEAPTIAELEPRIAAARQNGQSERPPLVPREWGERPALSFAQQRMWFLDQFAPGRATYNIPMALHLTGHLDVAVLERCFQEVINRHDTLRTSFAEEGGVAYQVIHEKVDWRLQLTDLSEMGSEVVQSWVDEEAARPFDLEYGSLFRVSLLRRALDDHLLLVNMHHIVSDGWSIQLLIREVAELYAVLQTGEPSPLEELPLQYVDFALWQRDGLSDGELLDQQLEWWREVLGGVPPLELPVDRPRPSVRSDEGAVYRTTLSQELLDGLVRLGREQGATLFMTLHACLIVLLERWTLQRDLALGVPIAGRTHREIEGLIGFFVNTLVLRARLQGGERFGDVLSQARGLILGAHEHQAIPFEHLVQELADADPSRTPLFQIFFNVAEKNAPIRMPGLDITPWPQERTVTRFDLDWTFQPSADGLALSCTYSTALFDTSTILRLVSSLEILLSTLLQDPERPVRELSLLSPAQRHHALLEWNSNPARTVDETTWAQVSARAGEQPHAIAVAAGEAQLSFRELVARAGTLAKELECGRRYGIFIDPSLELVTGLLGVFASGSAYVPLDPSYPKDRLEYMAEDADLAAILTSADLAEETPDQTLPLVLLDHPREVSSFPLDRIDSDRVDANRVDANRVDPNQAGLDLAYVIYTSGSTGKPKGVAIPHQALSSFLEAFETAVGLESRDTLLAVTPLSFDISGLEIFWPLVRGARLELTRRETAQDGRALIAHRLRQRITVMQATPATWQILDASRQTDSPSPFADLRILTGGEALPRGLATTLAAESSAAWNVYGPTEATIWATTWRVEHDPRKVLLGRPLANTSLFIVDRAFRPVALGCAGELLIGGDALAWGYLGRPGLTAERFVPNLFSEANGRRLYRSGDLTRQLADGRTEFLGRIDHQVKVRGFRIELGEIESVLDERLRECVVVAEQGASGSRLLAYVVGDPTVADLREHLRERLPEYMVPSLFVELDALPRLPNGKVNRRALPAPDLSLLDTERPFAAPRNPTEQSLAEIWRDVLQVEAFGIDDSFFELGGHSLLATQTVSRIHAALGVELPLQRFFAEPTIRGQALAVLELAAQIDPEQSWKSAREQSIRRREPSPEAPLSFAQHRLWFLHQLAPESPFYNMPRAYHFSGTLDPEILHQTFNEIVRRHESLRTRFMVKDGEPVQVIAPELKLDMPLIDLQGVSNGEAVAARLGDRFLRQAFDLEKLPLLALLLVRLDEDQHLLFLVVHHIVFDGWSQMVLQNEVTPIYESLVQQQPSPLRELPIQYSDFAVWQRSWLTEDVLAEQLDYWRDLTAGAPELLELPTDRPRPAVQTMAGEHLRFALPEALIQEVRALSDRRGLSFYMPLFSIFQVVLQRWSGRDDLLVGAPIANRNKGELEGMIGFFVNMLLRRTDLSGQPTFAELLARVRDATLEAYDRQDLPFERLVAELKPERNLAYTPLFQVMFNLLNFPQSAAGSSGLQIQPWSVDTATSKYDLSLYVLGGGTGEMSGFLEYSTDLFDATTMARMRDHYLNGLRSALAHPETPIAELSLMSEAEAHAVLVERNGVSPALVADGEGIHHLVASRAGQAPEAIALVAGEAAISHDALLRRAHQITRVLHDLGVGPDALVGVSMHRSTDMVAALLGVLSAGGAYVPLDPSYPSARLAMMLDDAQPRVLLTETPLIGELADSVPEATAVVCLDTLPFSSLSEPLPNQPILPGQLAYVIYTSGSTGRPKGVAVGHRSAVAFLRAMARRPGLTAEETFVAVTTLSFDIAGLELYLPLMVGARLVVADEDETNDGNLLAERLAASRATTMQATPATWNLLLATGSLRQGALGRILSGGEALTCALADQLIDAGADVWNVYGPTETTVWSSAEHVEPVQKGYLKDVNGSAGGISTGDSSVADNSVAKRSVADSSVSDSSGDGIITLGRPIAGTTFYILDPQGVATPVGVPGELMIGGAGLARGYLARPSLTAERFIPDPFALTLGARFYRTGDLVRYRASSTLEFLGRIDHQVKVRGFRIELGEIEASLSRHPEVRSVVVGVRHRPPTGDQLVAWLTLRSETTVDELRAFVEQSLPDYMIPAAFVLMDEFPRTPAGKIDRRALPDPEGGRVGLSTDFEKPTTELEKYLAECWIRVLGVDEVGLNDRFFHLGGNSIQAAIFTNELQEKLGEIVHVTALFRHQTIAELVTFLESDYHDALVRLGLSQAGEEEVKTEAGIDGEDITELRQLADLSAQHERGPYIRPEKRQKTSPIFVLSPPRAGSTLLRVMLAGHPGLFAPPELELLSFGTMGARSRAFTGFNSFGTEGLLRAVMELRGCDATTAKALMEGIEKEDLGIAEFYAQLQEWCGDQRLVDKTTTYALDPSTLRRAEELFENAHYIHLVRHPCATIKSYVDVRLDQFLRFENTFTSRQQAELLWSIDHQNILDFLRLVPPERQYRLRFEELLSVPEAISRELCDWLGMDFAPAMLEPYKGRRMTDGVHEQSRMHGDPRFHEHQDIDARVAEKWRNSGYQWRDLAPITQDLAVQLGYPNESESAASKLMIPKRTNPDRAPLSWIQEAFWAIEHMEQSEESVYRSNHQVVLNGPLDLSALNRSVAAMVERHEILRTRFKIDDEGLTYQEILPHLTVPMPLIDLTALAVEDRTEQEEKVLLARSRQNFDLGSAPVWRLLLVRSAQERTSALVSMHHIVNDHWSMGGIFFPELGQHYEAFAAGQKPQLPELPLQYADYAEWERERLQDQVLQRLLGYWGEKLAGGIPQLHLRTDHPRPEQSGFNGSTFLFEIQPELEMALEERSREAGVSLFMISLAAYQLLLARYSGQENILVGSPNATRFRAQTERLFGCFTNMLMLHTDFAGNPTLNEALGRVGDTVLGAFSHQELPFMLALANFPPQDFSFDRAPFQAMFTFLNTQSQEETTNEVAGVSASLKMMERRNTDQDLALWLMQGDGLHGTLVYDNELFDQSTIAVMVEDYKRLLREICQRPQARLDEVLG